MKLKNAIIYGAYGAGIALLSATLTVGSFVGVLFSCFVLAIASWFMTKDLNQ